MPLECADARRTNSFPARDDRIQYGQSNGGMAASAGLLGSIAETIENELGDRNLLMRDPILPLIYTNQLRKARDNSFFFEKKTRSLLVEIIPQGQNGGINDFSYLPMATVFQLHIIEPFENAKKIKNNQPITNSALVLLINNLQSFLIYCLDFFLIPCYIVWHRKELR